MIFNFEGVKSNKFRLYDSHLYEFDIKNSNIEGSKIYKTDLVGGGIKNSSARRSELANSEVIRSHIISSNLTGCNFASTTFIDSTFNESDISNSYVYGSSVWDCNFSSCRQDNLLIKTPDGLITVPNLVIAQLIGSFVANSKVREIIGSLTQKLVLILGRFTAHEKAILELLRKEFLRRDYVPVIFDFDVPQGRIMHETVATLSFLSKFVLIDYTNMKEVIGEQLIISDSTPCIPIMQKETAPPLSLADRYQTRNNLLPAIKYHDADELVSVLDTQIIQPAEAVAEELRTKRSAVIFREPVQ